MVRLHLKKHHFVNFKPCLTADRPSDTAIHSLFRLGLTVLLTPDMPPVDP